MSQFRNIDYLERNKIIYRTDPINDVPTQEFVWGKYYEEGTYECYTLFNNKAKITSYKSLIWHLHTLWYINNISTSMEEDKFSNLAYFIMDIRNGFITFETSSDFKDNIINDIFLQDLEKPPRNKLRKIIFKDGCGLTTREKLSLVGKIIGKTNAISNEDIYEVMLAIHDLGKKITITNIARELNVSTKTIYRNISKELINEKELLNSL
jgi:hypothetical protein